VWCYIGKICFPFMQYVNNFHRCILQRCMLQPCWSNMRHQQVEQTKVLPQAGLQPRSHQKTNCPSQHQFTSEGPSSGIENSHILFEVDQAFHYTNDIFRHKNQALSFSSTNVFQNNVLSSMI
jgi:hypothetical protein